MGSQQFCLRWNNHQTNLLSVFDKLLTKEAFVDVTIACEGANIKAHKVILSACSPFFEDLFAENPCKHPIVIMKDMKFCDLKAIVEFMYKGEVNVSQVCWNFGNLGINVRKLGACHVTFSRELFFCSRKSLCRTDQHS